MPFTPIFNALDEGATVIVPTNRLQREILWKYLHSKPQAVMVKPKCYAYENWLLHWFEQDQLTQSCNHQLRLLTDWQFQFLSWRACKPGLKLSELANLIMCFKNLHLAQTEPQGSDFLYHPQAAQFQDYWEAITAKLHAEDCIAKAELATWLTTQAYIEPPHPIWFACFDTLHPQQQALINALEAQGQRIHFYDLKPITPAKIWQFEAADQDLEQEAMLSWVLTQYRAGKQRIGVVVPDLNQRKHQLLRQLQDQIPATALHCSLGTALIEFPFIQQGLKLLLLQPQRNITHAEIEVLLHSPWLSGAKREQAQRQHLANYHRLLQEPILPWASLLKLCAQKTPLLHQCLQGFNPYPPKATLSNWIALFQQRLRELDFSQAPVDILNKFYSGIESLHALSGWEEALTLEEVDAWLTLKFQQEIHQPPQEHAGVHFMGWLEASGFRGDAIWICQFLSQNIPQPPNLSSWLPVHWQKQQQLPRTSYEKEQEIAKTLIQRLQAANPELVFSYPATIDQQAQWPSPLFPKDAQEYVYSKASPPVSVLETYQDPALLPLAEDEALKGGSQLMSAYANCPFQAFAKYRLHAQTGIDTHLGLDALENGQLMHQSLFYLWQSLGSQTKLKEMSTAQVDEMVEQATLQALTQFKEDKPYSLDDFMLDIEASKVRHILHQVLTFDLTRPSFEIAGLEQELSLCIEDLEFNLRYDRLDRLDNGDLLLIDYKSSLPTPLPWRSSQPLHPQILMYALAQQEIKGLMFAAPSSNDCQSSGVSADELEIKGIKPSKEPWESLQQQWLQHFQAQIIKLKAGDYQPNPAQASTCKRCQYQDICRFSGQHD